MKNIILRDTTKRKEQHCLDRNPFEMISKIQTHAELDEEESSFLRELKKKHSSYKSQDKLHHKFDDEKHITLNELVDKLVECKLLCYYCNQQVSLLYNQKKDPKQWTLERLNNNLGHYSSNTCIACLKCNLGRRTENHEYYKKGKTMILKKGI
jgi:hypothetical protein